MKKPAQRMIAIPSESASITAESDALAGAVATWLDVQAWSGETPRAGYALTDQTSRDSYPEFELDIDCDDTETLIGTPSLYACRLAPVTIADDTFTSSGATHTAASHALLDGDGPMRASSSTTLPDGLDADTDYYVEVASANTFKLHTTRTGAIAKATADLITTTDGGTGTHTIADLQTESNPDNNTRRFRRSLVGELNGGESIVLGAQVSHVERIRHSPLTLYYYVTATETSAQTVTIRVTPVVQCEE